MNAYLALTRSYLRLTLRDRAALFFSYIMPMVFFFMFSQLMHAERGTAVLVVNMVLTIGILGTGLFGAGVRAVLDRETNILRRFKVAPITPAPILAASFVVGLLNFLPIYVLVLALSNLLYGMPLPANLGSLTLFVITGLLAFRAIGLMVASVANSMQEAQILIQSLYMPMLFLSGATIPVSIMPEWVQIVAQFLPATHLFSGMQSILGGGESIARNLTAFGALALTIAVGAFLGVKLFRWEKEEKLPASAKLWVLGVLAPFVLMGMYQAHSKGNVAKNKIFDRELGRRVAYLVKNARIFTGDGSTIETGSVLVREGRIAQIYAGPPPSAKDLRASEIDGAGKTLLPGLIDVQVHLSQTGGLPAKPDDSAGAVRHALAAYLYCGVTAVRSGGDPTGSLLKERDRIRLGEQLGAEVFAGATHGNGVFYIPALTAVEAESDLGAGNIEPLERSLVQQVVPAKLLESAKRVVTSNRAKPDSSLEAATRNLVDAWRRGVTLATGTGSGNPLVFHGPAVHRELQLWVQAGIPPGVALQAATVSAARLLHAGDRIGLIKKGYEATLILVDGDPLKDITATERISTVLFKGERIHRAGLFDDEKEK